MLRLSSVYGSAMVESQRYETYKNRKAFISYITNKPNHKPKHKR